MVVCIVVVIGVVLPLNVMAVPGVVVAAVAAWVQLLVGVAVAGVTGGDGPHAEGFLVIRGLS